MFEISEAKQRANGARIYQKLSEIESLLVKQSSSSAANLANKTSAVIEEKLEAFQLTLNNYMYGPNGLNSSPASLVQVTRYGSSR